MTTTATGSTSSTTLAPWASNYVTSMLGQSSALAQQPYQWYQGAMTAGSSPLQQQAFQGTSQLGIPSSFGQAGSTLQGAASGLGSLGYSAGQFGNQYSAPGAYQTGQFQNQFNAPGAYQAGNITTGQWSQQAAQQYMNPYLQESLNPQLDQARRQAQQTRMGDASRLSQAGAFGGSRQAIMESELNRNLMQTQADITGKGYFDAYNTGMTGFMQDQGRALDASKATEQSRQFGAGQAMTAAQQRAQYGTEAQRMQEASRQFGYGQQMDAAEQQARYGLDALRLGEDSRQFGAQYGLDALKARADVGAAQGNLGVAENQMQRANLNQMLDAGSLQRGLEQQGLDAEYQMWAQAQQHPYQSLEFMKTMLSGIPTTINQENKLDDLARLTQILGGVDAIGDSGLFDYVKSLFPQG